MECFDLLQILQYDWDIQIPFPGPQIHIHQTSQRVGSTHETNN